MLEDSSDPILNCVRRIGLFNSSADRVKVGHVTGGDRFLGFQLLIYFYLFIYFSLWGIIVKEKSVYVSMIL